MRADACLLALGIRLGVTGRATALRASGRTFGVVVCHRVAWAWDLEALGQTADVTGGTCTTTLSANITHTAEASQLGWIVSLTLGGTASLRGQ